MDRTELTITRLGLDGDGMAEREGGSVFVPQTLPGERVIADVEDGRGLLIEVLQPSPDRVEPVCRHFGVCGGCALQHMSPAAELGFKSTLVRKAFLNQGITPPLGKIVAAGPGSRRRAVFAARRTRTSVVFGFHAARSHEIVDIAACPLLVPDIAARIDDLRSLAAVVASRSGGARLTVVASDTGIDVAVEDAKPELSLAERETVGAMARTARLARLAIKGETVFMSTEPMLRFGAAKVVPQPGVFLQAVAAIEAQMAAHIVTACGKAKRVADLFCGLGTFTFPIAAKAEVLAVDGDPRAIAELTVAARRTQGIKPVVAKVRDLFGEPLSAKELEAFDAVVFDPPRAGADAQAKRIAACGVRTVIAVSCAPATLARDVKTLVAGGYQLESVTPFDQFVFSPHVEAIAVLRRPRR